MINLRQFLWDSNLDIGTYALITYEGKTEPTWFANMGTSFNTNGDTNDWFLESPCCLYEIADVGEDVNTFVREYMDEVMSLNEDANEEEYVNNYVLPMIIDNVMYEIENFQCSPYLPEYVDDIQLITERECLEWMLQNPTK